MHDMCKMKRFVLTALLKLSYLCKKKKGIVINWFFLCKQSGCYNVINNLIILFFYFTVWLCETIQKTSPDVTDRKSGKANKFVLIMARQLGKKNLQCVNIIANKLSLFNSFGFINSIIKIIIIFKQSSMLFRNA